MRDNLKLIETTGSLNALLKIDANLNNLHVLIVEDCISNKMEEYIVYLLHIMKHNVNIVKIQKKLVIKKMCEEIVDAEVENNCKKYLWNGLTDLELIDLNIQLIVINKRIIKNKRFLFTTLIHELVHIMLYQKKLLYDDGTNEFETTFKKYSDKLTDKFINSCYTKNKKGE